MGAVQCFNVFTVDAARVGMGFLPDLLARLGSAASQGQFFTAHAVIFHHLPGQLGGDLLHALSIGCQAIFGCQPVKLIRVADGVDVRFALADPLQGFQDIAPVIGVSGSPGGDHARQVTGHDDIRVCAANAFLRPVAKRVDPAGSHGADAATGAQVAVAALRFLLCQPVPNGFDTLPVGNLQHSPGIRVDAFFLISVAIEYRGHRLRSFFLAVCV